MEGQHPSRSDMTLKPGENFTRNEEKVVLIASCERPSTTAHDMPVNILVRSHHPAVDRSISSWNYPRYSEVVQNLMIRSGKERRIQINGSSKKPQLFSSVLCILHILLILHSLVRLQQQSENSQGF